MLHFFYQAGAMSYGNGYFWHKPFNFPKFSIVTKTLTLNKKTGYPFAVIPFGKTVYNHIALHNIGLRNWLKIKPKNPERLIISINGTTAEIFEMVYLIETSKYPFLGIEYNFSCPNVKNHKNYLIPKSTLPAYLKLNYLQDPYKFDLNKIVGIRLNTIPCRFGGMSGHSAQKFNFPYIKKFNYEGLNIAGSSFMNIEDIKYLEEFCGCKEIGIGSTIILRPRLIEKLQYYF